MKTFVLTLVALCVAGGVCAQQRIVNQLTVEARGDWQHQEADGHADKDFGGFKGQYFNLIMSGQIAPRFTYSYRQRFNKAALDHSFFDATDWLHLDYAATDQITLSAGKQIIDIGGFEYDAAPINLYFTSEYWNNVPCYAWGVSGAWHSKSDLLRLQVCESPYRRFFPHEDIYTANLYWSGTHGFWSALWSANVMQTDADHYTGIVALGNRIAFSDKVHMNVDLTARSVGNADLLRDCTVTGKLEVTPSAKFSAFAQASYDVNRTDKDVDLMVHNGTELTRVGGGVEYFPLGNNQVRLHANYCYTFGTNTNPAGVLRDDQSTVNVGLTWRMNIIK